jgi:glycosyltransferase involved in cell wall biosynthesis
MSLFSLPATLLTKAKVITWEHFNFSVDLGKKAMRIGRFLSTKFSYAIVVLTDADRRIYLDTYKCFARVITISNFLPQFPVTNKRNDTAGNIALAVGRITKQKGYDRLVEIWSDYLSIRPDTNWKLKIVGDGEDLSLIQDLIDFHHLGNSISILPPTKNIQIHYESASIFLLTSRWEGLPMVLIESQANGIPSIAYNCKTGPAEIITNGVNGFLIEDGDKVKFVEALVELTESDEKRLTLSRNAKEMATNYSADKVVQKWINLFTS